MECLRMTSNAPEQPSNSHLLTETISEASPKKDIVLAVESEGLTIEPEDMDLIKATAAEGTHKTIMSACSSLGQHIRENITNTLNSRPAASDIISDSSLTVINNLGETFMQNISESLASNTKDTSNVKKNSPLPECETSFGNTTADASVASNDMPSKQIKESENETDPSATSVNNMPLEEISISSRRSSEDTVSLRASLSEHIRKIILEALATSNSDASVLVTSSNDDLTSVLDLQIMKQLENFELSIIERHTQETLKKMNGQEDNNEENGSLSEEADSLEKEVEETKAETVEPVPQQKINLNSKSSVNLEKDKSNKKTPKSSKKKGEKTIGFFTNQIVKSLTGLQTTEEKLDVLCRKHAESLEKLKNTENILKQNERQVVQLSREKEQLQADHNRNILAKSRLESLCRELQRQNKAVKDENLLRIREEEEKRKEVASKFQTTLNEISNLMQENSKKNLQLKEENAELAQKLKALVEHYEMWEKHMEKVVQQKDLEVQLAKVKEAKTNLQLKQDTENFLREKQEILQKMNDLQKKCTQLATNEVQLRGELGDYTSKYEEFQTVLNKSNQVFASFKSDMDSTSKKIKKLEKETNLWKQKWESSNNALMEMIADKQKRDKELMNAQQRIMTLEKLCRALQAERNDLQSQVDKNSS